MSSKSFLSLSRSSSAGPVFHRKCPLGFVDKSRQPPPFPPPPKRERPVFTIAPVVERRTDDEHPVEFGKFLEACSGCKKEFSDNDDVHMYSYLQAFCTPECRDKQIAEDLKENKEFSDSTISEAFLKFDTSWQQQRQKLTNFKNKRQIMH
ncbi:hypothetical protein Nepgr_030332 [Nepenthes gracilis]|uniref:FLZ-type domain-containing protein n=1 Tax=Nepenthes gracilis TaxID=150966 RepID=A0AAD3TG42_NEPGR|nr:hypothetical protein Nepgr_030332 [Nepenthes gracilis]